jgi:hypothetical protein
MAYTPINWTETTFVNATNLNQMDSQIDNNEQDIRNIEDGTTTVPNANNANILTKGLTDVNFYSDGGILGSNSSININIPFVADYILISSIGGTTQVNSGNTLFLLNTNSFSLTNLSGTETTVYAYLAVKRN